MTAGRRRPASTAASSPRSTTATLRAELPEAHGRRRRGADALRRPRRRQRAGARRCRSRTAPCTPTTPASGDGAAGLPGRDRPDEAGRRPRRRRRARRGRCGRAAARAAARGRRSPTSTTTASPELITTAGRHVYVWEADGDAPRRASPSPSTPDFCRPAGPGARAPPPQVRLPRLARRRAPRGRRRAGRRSWRRRSTGTSTRSARTGRGARLPGRARRPRQSRRTSRCTRSRSTRRRIGDLNGDGRDDIVVAVQRELRRRRAAPSTDPLSEVLCAGRRARRALYAINGKTGAFLPGWPAQADRRDPGHPAADRPGPRRGDHDAAAATSGSSPPRPARRASACSGRTPPTRARCSSGRSAPGSDATPTSTGAINLFESAVVGDVLGTGTPAVVKYGITVGAGGQPAAGRAEPALQPPDRGLRRDDRRSRCPPSRA